MATIAVTSGQSDLFRNLLVELKKAALAKLDEGASSSSIDAKYSDLNKKISALEDEGKTKDVVLELLTLFDELFDADEKLIAPRFYIVLYYSKLIEKSQPAEFAECIDDMIKRITASDDQAIIRIRLLASIFNIFSETSFARYLIYKAVFAYAAHNKFYKPLTPHIESFEDMMAKWSITLPQKRDIYASAIDVLKVQGEMLNLQHRYLKSYLELVQEENTDAVYNEARTKAFAQQLAVMSIQIPNIVKLETVTQLVAVQNLAKDSKTKALFALYSIFDQKVLIDFSEWYKKNPNTLKQFDLKYEDCLEKIRLLTLCTIAAGQKSLTYDAIAKALNITKEDVEFWVVNGVSNKYLGAQIDQLAECVHISHTTQRNFGSEDWKNLKSTLSLWKTKIDELKTALANARLQEAEIDTATA